MFAISMKKIVAVFLLNLFSSIVNSQIQKTDIENLDFAMQQKPQNIVILLSTDWCSYCHVQKKNINSKIKLSQKQNFYYVEFDAEQKLPIIFNNQSYNFNNKKNTHTFAQALQDHPKQMIYPYWVVLNNEYEIIYRYPGFLKPHQVKELLEAL